MFANHVDRSGGIGNTVANGLPRFAVIRCNENVHRIIIRAVAIERNIGRASGIFRSHYSADVRALRDARNLRRHVLPALSAVPRNLHVAVGGARPHYVGGDRPLTEGSDGPILLAPAVPRETPLVGGL